MIGGATRADILIVDDTPANLTVLSAILTKQGYRVRPAINGDLGLKAAQKSAPDLVLLDVQMPGIDGYEVCRRFKAEPTLAHIPIIFISALDDAADKVAAFQAGGVDYISKPFQIAEVLARVENHLTLRQQRAELLAVRQTLAGVRAAIDDVAAAAGRLATPLGAGERAELAARIADGASTIQQALAEIRTTEPA
jgi:two-component system, NtrC family, sensor kinase